jgi:hypothetical protein
MVRFPGQGKPVRSVKDSIPGISTPSVGAIIDRHGQFGPCAATVDA